MRVKKFMARTLPEAMAQVKADLGADAVILHTNEVKVGGLFGLFATRMIQVMAAVEQQSAAAPLAPAVGLAAAPALAERAAVQPSLEAMRGEMADVKAMISDVVERLNLPASSGRLEPELRELVSRLARGGVEDQMAVSLANRVCARIARGQGAWPEVREIARELIMTDLGQVRTVDHSSKVVALVGPTGVGKTTTLAKLAAHLALQQRKRIALITADTYRIGAVEQLRTYSEILGVPLEVVYDPQEASRALDRYRDRDLILFDTAGRSPKNFSHMQELKTYLDAIQPASTYLVMSLTSAYRDSLLILEHYLPVGIDHFLFTKWDETVAPGLIYNVVRKHKRPLSYVTTGQNVPDDIEVADPEQITRAILGD